MLEQRYLITHDTAYFYSGTVTLEPHTLLLRPREDHETRIESFSLYITPQCTWRWHRDIEGNSVALATFTQSATQLLIRSRLIISQYNLSPLDFETDDYALWYPFSYTPEDAVVLAPYREVPQEQIELRAWIARFYSAGEAIQTYSLLERLGRFIHDTLRYSLREESGVQNPAQTLSLGTGSCRDFALLFIEAARLLGLAARFVSGYLHAPLMAQFIGSTHAWAEVYLPGAGWKGFDPTLGAIAGRDHIPVAVSRLATSVSPISGSFIGIPGAKMEVNVRVEAL